MKGMIDTMIQFQEMDMLQKAALTALAWRASDEDTQHLRQIFECLDQEMVFDAKKTFWAGFFWGGYQGRAKSSLS